MHAHAQAWIVSNPDLQEDSYLHRGISVPQADV